MTHFAWVSAKSTYRKTSYSIYAQCRIAIQTYLRVFHYILLYPEEFSPRGTFLPKEQNHTFFFHKNFLDMNFCPDEYVYYTIRTSAYDLYFRKFCLRTFFQMKFITYEQFRTNFVHTDYFVLERNELYLTNYCYI